jgi:toxin ParE1/3/4
MPHIRYRPQVSDDIVSITVRIRVDSPASADRFLDRLHPTLIELAKMPGKGIIKRFRAAALSGVRTWRVPGFPNHLICYRPLDDGIEVLAIIHGARDLRRSLIDRLSDSR